MFLVKSQTIIIVFCQPVFYFYLVAIRYWHALSVVYFFKSSYFTDPVITRLFVLLKMNKNYITCALSVANIPQHMQFIFPWEIPKRHMGSKRHINRTHFATFIFQYIPPPKKNNNKKNQTTNNLSYTIGHQPP